MTRQFFLYSGTWPHQGGEGIYLFRFDASSGSLETLGLAAPTDNPMFLAIHPNNRYLYATGETPDPSINAFAVDPETGKLIFLNRQPSHGKTPCYLSVDYSGRFVLVANYTSGTIAVSPVNDDGRLDNASDIIQHHGAGLDPERQEAPHPHSVILSPDNHFVLVADLGTDRIVVYRLNGKSGVLRPNDPACTTLKPGAGPRHQAFHPNGKVIYSINEIDNTITVFAWDENSVRSSTYKISLPFPPTSRVQPIALKSRCYFRPVSLRIKSRP